MSAPIIAFFNNKGGVGKTSLVYHLSWMYADLGLTSQLHFWMKRSWRNSGPTEITARPSTAAWILCCAA